jgi:hypothetical protein
MASQVIFLRLNNSKKKSPYNPALFLKAVLGTYRPIRIWFYIWRKLFAAEENGSKKMAMKKINIFEKHFSPHKKN